MVVDIDRSCTIRVNGYELRGAICPVCRTRIYPPEAAARCLERHERLAALEDCRICHKCHCPRPRSAFKDKSPICEDCHAKSGRPPLGTRHKNYKEYLRSHAQSWEE